MRPLLAALFVLCATPVFAACPIVRDPDWGRETAAQAAQAVCLQEELTRRSLDAQRLEQLAADYRLRLQLLELELRMEQQARQLQLPSLPPIAPAF